MTTDIVEIYWNARPHLERLGVNLRRGGIDEGTAPSGGGPMSLVEVFPGTAVLVRFAVHAKPTVNDLQVLRPGLEQPRCIGEVRAAIEQALQQAKCEPA